MIKHSFTFIFALVLLLCTACNSKEARRKEHQKKIIGRWELNRQIVVSNVLEKEGRKDTTAGYWDAGYKPAQIEFGTEGNYVLVIKDIHDNLADRKTGPWTIQNDTLQLKYENNTQTLSYFVHDINDTLMVLKVMIDADDDLQTDDEHTGYYKRIVR